LRIPEIVGRIIVIAFIIGVVRIGRVGQGVDNEGNIHNKNCNRYYKGLL
jgi:hypothetical protein